MALLFLEEFGKAFIPDRFRPVLRDYLSKAGIYRIPYSLFGALFYISALLTGMIYIIWIFPAVSVEVKPVYIIVTTFFSWVVIQLLIAAILMSCVYFYLDLKIFNRTKKMESVMIEFLEFVSENLKGGMAFDKALWSAVKPQFTVLANEVRIASKKAATGEDIEEALMEFAGKYDSPLLSRSFTIIVEGMKSGGRVADVIDRVVENLRETKKIKQELNATVLNYVIFIFFIVVAVAPGLFALAKQLLIVLSDFAVTLAGTLSGSSVNIGVNFTNVAITPGDFTTFSVLALIVISVFSSMVISIIQRANIKGGIKYIPVTVAISLAVYFVSSGFLEGVFKFFFLGA